MSSEHSVADNKILKTTSKESDHTTQTSLDLTVTNLEENKGSNSSAEISQSQAENTKSVATPTSRDVLYIEACKEISNYAKCYVTGYLSIIRLTLNKLNALPLKSVVLQTKMLEMQSILAQTESFDLNAESVHEDDLYAIVREIGKIEDAFVAMKGNLQYKADVELLQQILTDAGFEATEERLTVARRLLVENFTKAFDNFMATITEAERMSEWELVEFYEWFSVASDFEKKYNYFDQFSPIFW